MIEEDVVQRSVEWHRRRMGYITGSKVSDIMKSGRKKDDVLSATAKTYLYQLAAERMFNPAILDDDVLFGEYIDQTNFTTKAMEWGIEQEENAKRLYMKTYHPDKELIEVSSCRHDKVEWFAASPDGMVRNIDGNGNMRSIEVKCPTLSTYMLYRTEIHDADTLKAVKPEYYWQVMAEMSCTGAIDADFITYCPWLSKPLHVAHIERNEDDINIMLERVKLANEFIDNVLKSNN